MNLSRPARLMAGITLITVPSIVYGGLTVLSVVTVGVHGLAAGLELTPLQTTLFRAGHAHAGALVILSLVLQVLIDTAEVSRALSWLARVTAPLAAILVSAGFFGIAFSPAFASLLWTGAACLSVSVVVTGVGLLRAPSQTSG
jgi:hypothetical protein